MTVAARALHAQADASLAQVPGVSSEGCASGTGERPWLDPNQPPACRALQVIARMTLDEKLAEVGGITGKSTNARLGLISGGGSDGPNGIAGGGVFPVLQPQSLNVTAFPTALTLAATWDRELATRYGAAIAEEFRGKGMDSVLGPTINILRTWRWGRAGETFSEYIRIFAQVLRPESCLAVCPAASAKYSAGQTLAAISLQYAFDKLSPVHKIQYVLESGIALTIVP